MIRWCDNGHSPLRVQSGQRCRACQVRRSAVRETTRPTPTQRGYGTAHRNARASLRSMLPGPCGYGCGVTLWPNGDWVAAHVVDGDPSAGWIASCRTCNERAKRGRMTEVLPRGGKTAGSVDRTARGFSHDKHSESVP